MPCSPLVVKKGGAPELVAGLKREGILCSAIGADSVRLVTHYDVSREDCERAAAVAVEVLQASVAA